MENEQQVPGWILNDGRFISELKELEALKENFVVRKIHAYSRRATQARLRFRISSTLIIGLSACLPFLTTLREGIWISIVLPIVAIAIAGLSGLNAFFRWESNWKGYSQARYRLEYLLKVWELKIIEARHATDTQKAVEIVVQATKQLPDDVESTTSVETEEYFKRVQIPKTSRSL
ncbi:DUF4231 domain-containing protein [Ktedonobacteria bacterium brp13]|nr:DUF4231 domain-containing protein [Ktedonobacteria bacterium brp13]